MRLGGYAGMVHNLFLSSNTYSCPKVRQRVSWICDFTLALWQDGQLNGLAPRA